jgi:hypothetical protein
MKATNFIFKNTPHYTEKPLKEDDLWWYNSYGLRVSNDKVEIGYAGALKTDSSGKNYFGPPPTLSKTLLVHGDTKIEGATEITSNLHLQGRIYGTALSSNWWNGRDNALL